MDKVIVVTSINPPKDELRSFASLKDWKLICVGDKKSPKDWSLKNAEFISIDLQEKLFPKMSKVFPFNLYARKNFGYLYSIKKGANIIYESDDDMFPYKNFPDLINFNTNTKILKGDRFININDYFRTNNYHPIWSRGFPITYIKKLNSAKESEKKVYTPIINSVQEDDGDFDTIYRFVIGKNIKFKKNLSYALEKRSYSPSNTQSTFHHKDVFPLLYIPGTVTSRSEDIFRGYISQRILWEMGARIKFISPVASTKTRNIHDTWKDFQLEVDLFLKIPKLVDILESLSLTNDPLSSLLKIYRILVKKELIDKEELKMIDAWAFEITKLHE